MSVVLLLCALLLCRIAVYSLKRSQQSCISSKITMIEPCLFLRGWGDDILNNYEGTITTKGHTIFFVGSYKE